MSFKRYRDMREPTELDNTLISYVIFILMAGFAVGIGVICVAISTGIGKRLFEYILKW